MAHNAEDGSARRPGARTATASLVVALTTAPAAALIVWANPNLLPIGFWLALVGGIIAAVLGSSAVATAKHEGAGRPASAVWGRRLGWVQTITTIGAVAALAFALSHAQFVF